jgi:hypothetical protein
MRRNNSSCFANQKHIGSIDPNTGKGTAIVERSQIGSEALRRENPNYSNYDIREIVTKDCIEIWQKGTIRNALPEEYKDKLKQEYGREGRQKQLEQAGSEQATEFAPFDENGNIQPTLKWAESGSFGPVEDVSEDFSKMIRGQDVITESRKVEKLQKRLTEQETELNCKKRAYPL